MRYEVKIDDELLKPMVHDRLDMKVLWPVLKQVEVTTTNTDALALSGPLWESGSVQRLCTRSLEICAHSHFPQNPEMQWRHTSLACGLTFELFRPFCFPFMSGFPVTTTHHVDSVCKAMEKEAPITWAPLRKKKLYGTVAGMTMCHQVLECY